MALELITSHSEAVFKTPWSDKALIRSDEGFSLRWGQDWAIYEEDKRKMTFTVDVGGDGATIFLDTICRWDDQPSEAVDQITQCRIVENVRNALAWKGFRVTVTS